MHHRFCPLFVLLAAAAANIHCAAAGDDEARPPNIVYIMSDELAYYELSHMGNDRLHTPNIDQMAHEGIRFTQALAAAPVCGPLRACMMTGKHMGHCSVRDNPGGTPLRADEPTIASTLKSRGYATGGFGKWGAGGRGSTGVPENHGFDVFFGYYDQVHAHSFYPPYLVRNSQEVELAGNSGGREGQTYSHYEIMDQGKAFIRENKDRPFFCYFPVTPPHGMYDIPADDPAFKSYEKDEWFADPSVSQEAKNYAAMVTMIDNDLKSILDLLRELDLEDNTIVFFTGDNGGQDRFRDKAHPRGYFGPNKHPQTGVEFRGGKGNLYEGGLRIPYLVRWPGKIDGGRVSDLLFSQVDVYPTLAELAGAKTPADLDGLSILTELIGSDATGHPQPQHEFLYWEYGSQTAVRMGDWKAIQPKRDAAWELYDLGTDVSEATDVSADHASVLEKMVAYAKQSHQPWEPGTFSTKELQERDRQAKWGSKGNPAGQKNRSQPQQGPIGKLHRIEEDHLIPSSEMSLVRSSSENTGNRKLAVHAIDGKSETLWHSRFDGDVAGPPHELVVDLGHTYQITGFRYLARQDNGWNGAFAKADFTVSDSADSFGDPAATKTFGKVRAVQSVDLQKPVSGRYIRVRSFSEVNGKKWASAAEIGVIGR